MHVFGSAGVFTAKRWEPCLRILLQDLGAFTSRNLISCMIGEFAAEIARTNHVNPAARRWVFQAAYGLFYIIRSLCM